MSGWNWTTTSTPDGTWTTTCRTCGDSFTTPVHSLLAGFRARHECQTDGGE